VAAAPAVEVLEMTKPETAGHAEMLSGGLEEIADRIAALLADRGLL
jgi:electron transfer flavoprotein alpha/beta subunit